MKGIDFFRLNEEGLKRRKEKEMEEEKMIYDALRKYVKDGEGLVLLYTIGPGAEREEYRVVMDRFNVKEVRKALEYMGGKLEISVPSEGLCLVLKKDDTLQEFYVEVKNDE